VILLVGAALTVMLTVHVNFYAITPGQASPVGPRIMVVDHPHASVRKTILLTDIYETHLTILQWLIDTIHPVHVEIVPSSDLTGGNVPVSELDDQGYLDMYDSKQSAEVAGMRAVGYRVTGTPAGAAVVAVFSHAPAEGVLSVADRIVEARGRPVRNLCGLLSAMSGAAPGTSVALRVERAAITNAGDLTYTPAVTVTAPTGSPLHSGRAKGCPGRPLVTAVFGIAAEDAVNWHFPVKVSINTAYIGGPSAGLAMALGVVDALSTVSITGGIKVAATGTISPSGAVGPIGGVAEKTIAVENAGATLFLVPVDTNKASTYGITSNYTDARHAASPSLRVIGVTTLRQALQAIERYRGRAPVPITGTSGGGATS